MEDERYKFDKAQAEETAKSMSLGRLIAGVISNEEMIPGFQHSSEPEGAVFLNELNKVYYAEIDRREQRSLGITDGDYKGRFPHNFLR